MEVILLKNVKKLGNIGDVITVKAGFFRNYLNPRNICLVATEENKKVFEDRKAHLEAENLEHKKSAEAVAAKISNSEVVIIRSAGEAGHLYGSVKTSDIAKAVAELGYNINKSQVVLPSALKTLGVFEVSLALHADVTTSVIINIARSLEESKTQLANYKKAQENSKNEEGLTKAESLAEAIKKEEMKQLEALSSEDAAE